jgi:D-alanyl-D-alanine carboxypeptidase
MARKRTPTAAVSQKPAKQAVKAEPFSALVEPAAAGKSRDSWNGMQVFVMDPATGRVLVSVGADTPHDPASLTKMALFYVAQEAIRDRKLQLDTFITITPEMANAPYSKLVPGERLKVARLIDAMMIESDNGAARIIASQVSAARDGKDAVDLMNAAADRLKLKQTHFINVGGLPAREDPMSKPGETKSTTAREMATLIGRIHQEFPAAMKHHMTAQTVEYGRDPKTGGNVHQANHLLLKPGSPVRLPEGYELAAKTGRTDLAGNVIAYYVTAPDGRELISVVFAPFDMPREQARAMGVPRALLGDGAMVNGNRPRDALGRQLIDHFIGPKAQAVAQQRPVPAPALATPPVESPQPPSRQRPRPHPRAKPSPTHRSFTRQRWCMRRKNYRLPH